MKNQAMLKDKALPQSQIFCNLQKRVFLKIVLYLPPSIFRSILPSFLISTKEGKPQNISFFQKNFSSCHYTIKA